jgi:hypothetical protein
MGIEDRVSLVDRHQSCSVEGTNKRHLRTLVLDERVLEKWSHVSVLKMVKFILNYSKDSETGYKPFELKFGSDAATYFRLAEQLHPDDRSSSYCKFLNENLRNLRQISKTYQDQSVQKRLTDNSPVQQNIITGDFVLRKLNNFYNPRPFKLCSNNEGPYEVLEQVSNEVNAFHMAKHNVRKMHVGELILFSGTKEEAIAIAMLVDDSYFVDSIMGYKGDPDRRMDMQFLIRSEDQEEVWPPYDSTIFQLQAYEQFCTLRPESRFLLESTIAAKQTISNLNRMQIQGLVPEEVEE